jgi:pyruvate dehydrogenase E2 component (dihydrolipoamide acetyltransferase)
MAVAIDLRPPHSPRPPTPAPTSVVWKNSVVELERASRVGKGQDWHLNSAEYNAGTLLLQYGMFEDSFWSHPPVGWYVSLPLVARKIVPDSKPYHGWLKNKRMAVTFTCDHRQIYGSDACLQQVMDIK